MANPAQPADETRRLQVLRDYGVLDTGPEQAIDALTALAALVCRAPFSLVTLVDERRQWFKSRVGLDASETPREISFCAHALDQPSLMVVEDTLEDARFADNPLVLGEPHIRFYAGAPLRAPTGEALGTLCVLDQVPRRIVPDHAAALEVLSRQVMAQLEVRRQSRRIRDIEEQLFAVFRAVPVGVAVNRLRDRVFIDVNESFADLVGLGREDIVGRTAEAAGLDVSSAPDIRQRLREGSLAAHVPITFRRPDGHVRHFLAGIVRATLNDEEHTITTVVDLTDQRRAEEGLVASEERLRLALDAAHMGIYDWDIPSNRITWSRWHEELWGFVPGTFDGTYEAFAARVHPDDLPGVAAEVERCLAAREAYEHEFRVVRPDGTTRWVTGRGEFVFSDDGRPTRMRGVVLDTTARHRIEERVRHLNRAYAVLSDINQTIVRETDVDAMLAAACRIAVEKGGFQMAWVGLTDPATGLLSIRAHAGADQATLGVLRRLIDTDPPEGCAFTRHAMRHGEHAVSDDIAADPKAAGWRDAALARGYRTMAAFPLPAGGRVLGVFSVYGAEAGWFDDEELQLFDELASDLSYALEVHERDRERRQADERRRQAEERFRQLAESIQQVFWMADPATREILYVSPAYETVWGRPCDSVYGSEQAWFEAVHPDDRPRVLHAVEAHWASGEYDEVYRIVRPDGAVRWIRDRAYPVREPDGVVHRIAGTATDVTHQRQLEDQLLQSQKMESIGRLAGGIAHDFNNLLTVINGIADLAMVGLQDLDPLRADLDQIRQAGARAASLTRQLLALSRQQILKPRVLDLSAVVASTESMLRRIIGEDVRIELELAPGIGRVRADPGQIEQVLLNLVVNARDAMPDGGTLRIRTEDVVLDAGRAAELALGATGAYVMLSVSDTGVGMDEATRQMIFEPFFTTKEVGKGTGLGLSTVYGIVRQSGGAITVDSEPGRGTRFGLYLPAVAAEGQAAPAAEARRATDGSETILLVEDERPLRQLTRRILSGAGYTVLEAGNGEDALEQLARHRGEVHLVVTDVVMPGMSGRDLADLVAEAWPSTKVLYVSGYTDDAILRHGVLSDSSRYLAKPYTPAELKRKVRELLDA